MYKQQGVTLSGALMVMIGLAFVGLFAAKLLPSYLDYFSVKKIFATMEKAGDTKGTVGDIRRAFDRRNAVEDIKVVRSEDLEITKEGGEAVITASWSVRIPMVYNISACLDFTATTAE